jgi:hypothetical protein
MPQETGGQITREWLEANGFKAEKPIGWCRDLAEGPGDTKVTLCVGRYLTNTPGVWFLVADFGVLTNAGTTDDILALVRLFEGASIDHPYEA